MVDNLIANLSPPVTKEKPYKSFRCEWELLDPAKVVDLLQHYLNGTDVHRDQFEIIDVRHDVKDFLGGNIITARNIPFTAFKANLGNLFNELYQREIVIIHCM
eukprot:391050_1